MKSPALGDLDTDLPRKPERPSYEVAVEEALAAENPKEATIKLATMYLRDINNDVRCDLSGQPNSPEVKEFNWRRNVAALSACAVTEILSNPALLGKLAAAIKAAR